MGFVAAPTRRLLYLLGVASISTVGHPRYTDGTPQDPDSDLVAKVGLMLFSVLGTYLAW